MLYVLNRGIRLDIGVEFERNTVLLQKICDTLRYAKTDEIGVGRDERFFQTAGGDDSGNLIDCAVPMIGNAIQNKTIDCHICFSFV